MQILIDIEEILFQYDGPFLFIGSNTIKKDTYINIKIDVECSYLSTPITTEEIILCKNSKISVDSLFLKDNAILFLGSFYEFSDQLRSFKINSIKPYIDKFIDSNPFFLTPDEC